MLGELSLQDCGRFQGAGIALVGRGLAGGEVERAENLGFVIVAVALGQRLKSIRQGPHTRAVGPLGEMVVIGGDRLDVIALALGFGADRPAALYGCQRKLCLLVARADRERIADKNGRDPPRGDGARRVAAKCIAESPFARGEAEGMQPRHAALETLLSFRCAGIGKGHLAQSLGRIALLMRRRERGRCA
jgi:hypothetical protein